MNYIVRIETIIEGHRRVEVLKAHDLEDGKRLARRINDAPFSSGTRPKRTCTVCVRIITSVGPIIVPHDKVRLVADQLYAAAGSTALVAVGDED